MKISFPSCFCSMYIYLFFFSFSPIFFDREKLVIYALDNGISFYGVEQQVAGQAAVPEKKREREKRSFFFDFIPSSYCNYRPVRIAHVSNAAKSRQLYAFWPTGARTPPQHQVKLVGVRLTIHHTLFFRYFSRIYSSFFFKEAEAKKKKKKTWTLRTYLNNQTVALPTIT